MQEMTSREKRIDVNRYAAAIARWDDDGGAFMSALSNIGARVSNGVDTKLKAESPADLKIDQSAGDDRKIIECLGAAVITRWDSLPAKIQRELFEHAASVADLGQTTPPKGQIARFLHNHKGDRHQTVTRVVL